MIQTCCPCGRALVLRDELAGRAVRCPECGGRVEVPHALEVVDDGAAAVFSAEATPPPLPVRNDEDLGEVADERVRPGPSPTPRLSPALPLRPKLEEPPPLPQRGGRPKRKRKKQSIYNEYYGNESGQDYANDWLGISGGGLTTILGGVFLLLMGLALLAMGVVWIGGIILLLMVAFGALATAMNGSKDE
jgi:hypothetical protein